MLTATGININNFINKQKVLGASVDVSSLQEEKNYWENLIKKNPTFVDGYLQLAKIYSLMGKKDEAILQIKSALSFDPNSMKIIQVQRLLNL
jgi:tetratricopeptide (TPR) repeat protein